MKNVIVVLFVGINFLACDLHSPNYKQKLKNETTVLNSTSETDDCGKENYKHKLEAEIVDMTPAQIIDEMAKEQIYHMPAFGDDYGNMLNEYIPKDKVKILPVRTYAVEQEINDLQHFLQILFFRKSFSFNKLVLNNVSTA